MKSCAITDDPIEYARRLKRNYTCIKMNGFVQLIQQYNCWKLCHAEIELYLQKEPLPVSSKNNRRARAETLEKAKLFSLKSTLLLSLQPEIHINFVSPNVFQVYANCLLPPLVTIWGKLTGQYRKEKYLSNEEKDFRELDASFDD